MKKFGAVLAVAMLLSGCSMLEKLGLKGADVDLAQDLVKCVQKAADAVQDQSLTHDEKVDVAAKSAAECSKPVVNRFVK